ncbi:phosphatidate cytidylyltransferase [Eubacterium brachy ATCC 33089]|jgi:cytidylyltransferase family|nr:phosphatidate cytidylyltransferase [Eubacterium brachy ATCC 33089]
MKTRIISGVVMLPLLAVLYFGGWAVKIAGFLVAVIGIKEFYSGFEKMDIKPSFAIGMCSAAMLYCINIFYPSPEAHFLWLFLSILACLLYLFDIDNRKLEDGMATATGIIYIVFFSYHIVLFDQLGYLRIFIWLAIISAFGTDIFAYFVGMALGKHKLCPKISPKKSIEGSVGGIVGSVILSGIFTMIFAQNYIMHGCVIGLLGSVVSQFGDLTASVFKRKMGIKDYGKLIPGHGGILDRFDSVLFTAPVVYYYVSLVIPAANLPI